MKRSLVYSHSNDWIGRSFLFPILSIQFMPCFASRTRLIIIIYRQWYRSKTNKKHQTHNNNNNNIILWSMSNESGIVETIWDPIDLRIDQRSKIIGGVYLSISYINIDFNLKQLTNEFLIRWRATNRVESIEGKMNFTPWLTCRH